jgi:hypothetical protein
MVIAAQSIIPGVEIRLVAAQKIGEAVYLWLGDRGKSALLLRYDDNSRRLEVIAEEGVSRCIGGFVPVPGSRTAILIAGDRAGNVFRLDYDEGREAKLIGNFSARPHRLTLRWNYFIGEGITCITTTENRWRYMWYHTIGGAFGAFMTMETIPPEETMFLNSITENMRMLREVELALADHFFQLTKADHIAFRNRAFPAAGTLDLDLLGWFSKIADEKRMEIAQAQNQTVQDIEIVINRMKAYFWRW